LSAAHHGLIPALPFELSRQATTPWAQCTDTEGAPLRSRTVSWWEGELSWGVGEKELLTVVHALRVPGVPPMPAHTGSPSQRTTPERLLVKNLSQRQARWSENQRLQLQWEYLGKQQRRTSSHAPLNRRPRCTAQSTLCMHGCAPLQLPPPASASISPALLYCTLTVPDSSPQLLLNPAARAAAASSATAFHRHRASTSADTPTKQVCYNFSTSSGNWTTAVHDQPGATRFTNSTWLDALQDGLWVARKWAGRGATGRP
jgi:hypothetical protein